jgi:hypothetical protein
MSMALDSPTLVVNSPAADRPVTRMSVYTDCKVEIDRFKWIESERVGYDLGESAVRQWVQDHWRGYLRARWLEHLQGKRFWIELDRGDFGLLSRDFPTDRDLLNAILEQLKSGHENLDVLCWARHHQIPSDSVLRILEALDINSRRLLYRFDTSPNRN